MDCFATKEVRSTTIRTMTGGLAALLALPFGCGHKGQEPETTTQPKKPTTRTEAAKPAEACKSALKAQGWKLESTFDTPQMLMLSYKKGKRGLNLGVSKEEGPTRIQYQVSSE